MVLIDAKRRNAMKDYFGALLGEQAGLTPSINNIDLDAILQAAMARMKQ